jgi:hypothetical protein
MSVVRREAARRWALVGAAVAIVCLAPVVIAALPAPGTTSDPTRLRDLILASAARPYQGYLDVHGELGLPALPAVGGLADLLSGSISLRAWYASPRAWRVAELAATGETDTYRTADSTYVWDFESNLLTRTIGEAVRLPRAADLLPPNLARRLLEGAASDQLASIPARRVAGVAAATLRWTPSDPDTTVGRVDVWADPETGLPLRVDVAGRDGGTVFTVAFQELDQRSPSAELLVPSRPRSAGYTVTTAQDTAAAINSLATVPLPAALAGRKRSATPSGIPEVRGLGAYGQGLAVFAVAAIPGRTGAQTLQAVREGGGLPVEVGGGEAYEVQTSLVNALIVRTPGAGRGRRTYMLAGSVSTEVLRQAGAELLALPQVRP